GLIFVISAPSGTGKTTLIKRVIKELSGLKFSISYTTRPPRANERNGEDYYFISQEEFLKMVERDEFLEWAEVMGNRYGTAKIDPDQLKSSGLDLILDIDPQGARKVLKNIKNAILIYILPPSLECLRERLKKRGLDSEETIKFRLANARNEMDEADWYHYVIVNNDIDHAVEKLKAIIIAERCRNEKASIIEENKRKWEVDHGKNYG
ncbi:MAG: guanylate kinase, partial [Thermodesulfobacteriota bacterium]